MDAKTKTERTGVWKVTWNCVLSQHVQGCRKGFRITAKPRLGGGGGGPSQIFLKSKVAQPPTFFLQFITGWHPSWWLPEWFSLQPFFYERHSMGAGLWKGFMNNMIEVLLLLWGIKLVETMITPSTSPSTKSIAKLVDIPQILSPLWMLWTFLDKQTTLDTR